MVRLSAGGVESLGNEPCSVKVVAGERHPLYRTILTYQRKRPDSYVAPLKDLYHAGRLLRGFLDQEEPELVDSDSLAGKHHCCRRRLLDEARPHKTRPAWQSVTVIDGCWHGLVSFAMKLAPADNGLVCRASG